MRHLRVTTVALGLFALALGSPPTVLIDQSGLTAGFVSGVTDFDAYMAGNPRHTTLFSGFEWFSNPSGITSGFMGFDLGATYQIDRLAFWNDEFSGTGSLTVFIADNAAFVGATNVGTFNPTNHPQGGLNYPADVFGFAPTSGRYVRLGFADCPQSDPLYQGCSAGELAFSVNAAQVPEPVALSLFALAAVGAAVRRRRRQ
jgi:hypothetical protein